MEKFQNLPEKYIESSRNTFFHNPMGHANVSFNVLWQNTLWRFRGTHCEGGSVHWVQMELKLKVA